MRVVRSSETTGSESASVETPDGAVLGRAKDCGRSPGALAGASGQTTTRSTLHVRVASGSLFSERARFWLNLQTSYDLEVEADRLGTKLARDVEVLRRAG
jgi:hypothetical protein